MAFKMKMKGFPKVTVPQKPKSLVEARPKKTVELNPDSDDIAQSVSTVSDVIRQGIESKKDPDTQRGRKIAEKLLKK